METPTRRLWTAIVLGGFVAGTIDIGAAALINWINPVVIMQAIANGVLGRASFFDGAPSAILGVLLQWAMALIIAAVYVFSGRSFPVLVRRWIGGGIAYGVAIFFVMNYVVVPLSRAMAKPHLPHFSPAKFGENLLAMILFGLIVAYFARRTAELHSADGRPLTRRSQG
ncbi:MAG TPA: hypothetical protein VGI20_03735 [Rhizomicrobium sp.]|jgi:uncharacterized membrane protein YagU involved in acid resistance